MEKIILASGSPRRKEILQKHHVNFEILASDVNEKFSSEYTKEQIPMILALRKALDIEQRFEEGIVIAADTIVFKDEVLGKPIDKADAMYMLGKLSGNCHQVITGVAIIRIGTPDRVVFYETTDVYFKKINNKTIEQYIGTGEVWDKAGAYAIQGIGAKLIEKIDGDYYNVMGLPFEKLKLVFNKWFNVKL